MMMKSDEVGMKLDEYQMKSDEKFAGFRKSDEDHALLGRCGTRLEAW